MKIVVVGCTHAGTAAVVNLKELHPESEITIYEKNDNIYVSWIVHMFINFAINTIGGILYGIF